MRERVFVYQSPRGNEMVFGAQGDAVLDEVVAIAAGIHREMARKHNIEPIGDDEVRSGILSAARQVSYELERRNRMRTVKSWARRIIGLK